MKEATTDSASFTVKRKDTLIIIHQELFGIRIKNGHSFCIPEDALRQRKLKSGHWTTVMFKVQHLYLVSVIRIRIGGSVWAVHSCCCEHMRELISVPDSFICPRRGPGAAYAPNWGIHSFPCWPATTAHGSSFWWERAEAGMGTLGSTRGGPRPQDEEGQPAVAAWWRWSVATLISGPPALSSSIKDTF